MSEAIRILIADDHPIVRQGMETLIGAHADLDLVGQAINGAEAVRMAKETQPDVIIMDLQMPVLDGVSAMEQIGEAGIKSRILVLTSFPDDDLVMNAIKAGASGLLLKDSPPQQLLDAIRTIHRGESALHPTVMRRLMQEVQEPSTPDVASKLTAREVEVLECLARGLSNQQIALELSISVRTVTTHVRNILNKLQLENRTQAALFAVESGIIHDMGK